MAGDGGDPLRGREGSLLIAHFSDAWRSQNNQWVLSSIGKRIRNPASPIYWCRWHDGD